MAKEKAFTITVTRTREVEVYAENLSDAKRYVKDMYESGDACAELLDATYVGGNVRTIEEVENDNLNQVWDDVNNNERHRAIISSLNNHVDISRI